MYTEEDPTTEEKLYYARYRWFSSQIWKCFDKVGDELPGDEIDPEEYLIIPLMDKNRKNGSWSLTSEKLCLLLTI